MKSYPQKNLRRVKKTSPIVDNLSGAEEKRLQLIRQIQAFHKEGLGLSEISRRTGKHSKTVKKYLEGDPTKLCRSNCSGILDQYKDFIIKFLRDGLHQAEVIRQLNELGYDCSDANARVYIKNLRDEYGIKAARYRQGERTERLKKGSGSSGEKFDYITRKGIFNHLWMNDKLTDYHKRYIFNKYPILYKLGKCINEFREIFSTKNMPLLYLFIEDYKNYDINEISSFAKGLENDFEAVENAVASDLSNGYVEGSNNKLKMVKRTMYGRCSRKLLTAKLMYHPRAGTS